MTETKTLESAHARSDRPRGSHRDESEWPAWKTALSMLIGAALGASVYGLAELRHTREQAENAAHVLPLLAAGPAPAATAEQTPTAEPAKPEPVDHAEHAPQPAEPEAVEPDPNPKARALAARTAAERALLDEARSQLEANNAAGAQATLDRMKKRFAHGALVQERELLRIEVYKARGQAPAAKRAARKLAKAYPESPHLVDSESSRR